MKRFADLFLNLDRTNKTNEKVSFLKSYFLTETEEDKIWALSLFTGRKFPGKIKSGQLQEWAMEQAGIPHWLFIECYSTVGDLAETISLILPENDTVNEKSLHDWYFYLSELSQVDDASKKDLLINAWRSLSRYETFVFNKLLMGNFRIGVSQTLVVRAISEAFGLEPSVASHRIMGNWDPREVTFHELILGQNTLDEASKPYPFYLSYALETDPSLLGEVDEWIIEWKWDGIRAQIIYRVGELYIWSRGEDLVTAKFPELHIFKSIIPQGTVIDGEIVCYANEKPLPFNILQTRIGRKNLTKKILEEAPVAFIAYDIMEYKGNDVRDKTQLERRILLENIYNENKYKSFVLSPVIDCSSWDELRALQLKSREHFAEGFMLKRRSAQYLTGRKKGDWWKWKIDPLSIDAVLIYAMKGHGRRADLFTDYTFAVWENGTLVPFAKAYSGLTDEEIAEVDRYIRKNTIEKFGPVRTVKPELVFEVGFEGINASSRHKSGIAVRFPRILRWRKDKNASEADTLDTLKAILQAVNGSQE